MVVNPLIKGKKNAENEEMRDPVERDVPGGVVAHYGWRRPQVNIQRILP
jgi:hypothetical protein